MRRAIMAGWVLAVATVLVAVFAAGCRKDEAKSYSEVKRENRTRLQRQVTRSSVQDEQAARQDAEAKREDAAKAEQLERQESAAALNQMEAERADNEADDDAGMGGYVEDDPDK